MSLWTSLPAASTVADGDEFVISSGGLYYRATRGQVRQQLGEGLELQPAAGTNVDSPNLDVSGYDASGVKRTLRIKEVRAGGTTYAELRDPVLGQPLLRFYDNGDLQIYSAVGQLILDGIVTSISQGGVTVRTYAGAVPSLRVFALPGMTVDLQQWFGTGGTVVAAVGVDGGFKPAALADAGAANNTLYYSTDAGKLVYKDGAGVVNNLY